MITMISKEKTELNVQTLLALRQEGDALRVISEKLGVKDMGPADHIRTKHEVKLFIASGDVKACEMLIQQAYLRAVALQTVTNRLNKRQQQSERIGV